MSGGATGWPPRAPGIGERLEISDWRDVRWFLRKYKFPILGSALAGILIGAVTTYFFPPKYTSEAKVRFLPPQVAGRFVDPSFSMQVEQRLFALSQLLSSRLTATRMIENFHLYPERRRFQTVADLVPLFQEDLRIFQIGSDGPAATKVVPTLSLCFRNPDAAKAQKVIQKLVEQIYEENRKYRGDQSLGTTEFLNEQVKAAEEKVLEAEARLGEIRDVVKPNADQVRMGESTSRAYVVDSRLRDLRHDLRGLEERRAVKSAEVLQLEVAAKRLEARDWRFYIPQADGIQSNWHLHMRVNEAEIVAKRMRETWRPGVPDRVSAEQDLVAATAVLERVRRERCEIFLQQEREAHAAKLVLAQSERRALDSELAKFQKEELELRAESVRLRDQQVAPLGMETDLLMAKREYDVARGQYDALQKHYEQSKSASEMERRGQGESVELLEPATLPQTTEQPSGPMRVGLIALAGVFIGLLACLWKASLHTTVLHDGHIEKWSGLQILATFPSAPARRKEEARKQTWRGRKAAPAVVALLLILTGCSDAFVSAETLWKRGVEAEKKGSLSAALLFYRAAVRKDAKHSAAHGAAGRLALRMSEPIQAYESLIRAVELSPADGDLHVLLGDTLYQVYFSDPGRPAAKLRELEALAEKIRSRWPQRQDGYRIQSHVLLERHRPVEAAELLKAAMAKVQENQTLRAQLAAVQFRLGAFNEAERTLLGVIATNPAYAEAYDLLYLQRLERKLPGPAREALELKWAKTKTVDAAIQLAGHYDASGDREAARTLLTGLQKRTDLDGAAIARSGDFWMHRGEWVAARAAYEFGLERSPSHRALYVGRIAEWHMAQNKHGEAAKLLESELAANRRSPEIDVYLAAIRLGGAPASARAEQRKKLESVVHASPDSAFARYHLGRAFLMEGNLPRAGEQFERCVKLDPNYAPGWVALAELDLRSGNAAAAEQRAEFVLRTNPRFLPAILARAKAQVQRGKAAEGGRALEQVLAAQPENTEALYWLASAQLSRGEMNKAMETIGQGRRQEPDADRWLLVETEALLAAGRPAEARDRLERARAAGSAGLPVLEKLAWLLVSLRDGAAAAKAFEELTARNPSSVDYLLGRAGALALAGDRKAALARYEEIQKLPAADSRAWVQHAALLSEGGETAAALRKYEEALAKDKDNPYLLNNLAWAILKSGGNSERALEYAQQARRALGRSAEIDDTLAAVYMKLAMHRSAAAVYEEMLTYLPDTQKERVRKLLAEARKKNKTGGAA
ncbi:MAG: tetratricopeptide repeat protein [Acidobacteria bacterium]|nr:tetratricopeptide repeat protein [Acidobacteriota bacterium]